MRTQTATVKSREMNGQLLHQMGGDADGARIPIAGGNAIDNTFFAPQILYKAGACGNALAGALIVSQSRRGALGDGEIGRASCRERALMSARGDAVAAIPRVRSP